MALQKYDLKKLYQTWITGFIANGGSSNITYTIAFPRTDGTWRVAIDGETIVSAFGINAKNILVPASMNILIQNLGHNNVYYLSNSTMKSKTGFFPKYQDITI